MCKLDLFTNKERGRNNSAIWTIFGEHKRQCRMRALLVLATHTQVSNRRFIDHRFKNCSLSFELNQVIYTGPNSTVYRAYSRTLEKKVIVKTNNYPDQTPSRKFQHQII